MPHVTFEGLGILSSCPSGLAMWAPVLMAASRCSTSGVCLLSVDGLGLEIQSTGPTVWGQVLLTDILTL